MVVEELALNTLGEIAKTATRFLSHVVPLLWQYHKVDFLLHSVESQARETADLQCASDIGYACSGILLKCVHSRAMAVRETERA